MEECLNSYPLELMYALLELTDDLYKDAKMQQSEHLTRLIELTQGHVDRGVVNEIVDKFLIQGKVQFQQNIFKLNEKCKALEVERKALQMKFQRANQSIQRIEEQEQLLDQKNRQLLEAEQRNVIPEEPHSAEGKHSTPRLQPAEASPRQAPVDFPDSGAGGNSMGDSPEHDASLLGPKHLGDAFAAEATREGPAYTAQLEQQVDVLRQENAALKERSKEIRLNLQRKITELQDTLTISRQKYMTELSQLKVEYGKDLNRLSKASKERQEEIENQQRILKESEIDEERMLCREREMKLEAKSLETERKAEEAVITAENEVKAAERELKKLKKESTGYFKGGWGTFIIAFEDKSVPPGVKSTTTKSSTTKVAKKKTLVGSGKESSSLAASEEDTLKTDRLQDYPHPISKISHFVEVGFLIDRSNFRLLNTFQEVTFDSKLKKYLFELQDQIDSQQMYDLEFKIKHQLTENVGLFNEINPVYISLNMGRPPTPFFDDYVPQDQFRLIQREGLYLMGTRFMMINFLKCDYITQTVNQGEATQNASMAASSDLTDKAKMQPHQFTLRVIAFENETSSQFSFDLNYSDLLIMTGGNLKLLEDESSHDLCQIILNNLTMIKREKVDAKGQVVRDDVLIAEHKVFFNEQHRAVYDKKNKINKLAKYDKKRQGLVKDVNLQTEF